MDVKVGVGPGIMIPLSLGIGLKYEVIVKDFLGNVIDYESAPSYSFVRQWQEIMRTAIAHATTANVRDIENTLYTIARSDNNLELNPSSTGVSRSLVAGTGNTAVTISDYKIETQVTTNWVHSVTTIRAMAIAGTEASFEVQRNITNNTGSSVGIKEVGIYVEAQENTGSTFKNFLGVRDVLGATKTIPNRGSLTITYTLTCDSTNNFLRQWLDIVRIQMQSSSATVRDTSNANQTAGIDSDFFDSKAAAANDDFGPLIGTSSTAVGVSDYALGAKIAHGTGAGEMEYALTSVGSPTISGSTSYVDVQRVITNNSGSGITVEEVGLYIKHLAGGPYYFAVLRNLTGGLAVADAEAFTLTFRVQVTV